MNRWNWMLAPALSVLFSALAPAQTVPVSPQSGENLRVFLVTMGSGSDPWEKFGHNCILIMDPDAGDVAYNWGVFSFGEGVNGFLGFTWHFLQGRLWYSMEGDPAEPMLRAYEAAGRSLLAQELNLTAAQKLSLQRRLVANDTDANRYYLYDYYRKNCSTMARDVIDETVDGRVSAALKGIDTGTTYRWHNRRLTADDLWLYTFLEYVLGHPVDRNLSAWQESFLPAKLAEHIRQVQVPDGQGNLTPLVKSEQPLFSGSITERKVAPRYFIWGFLLAGIGIGGLLLGLGFLAGGYRASRWVFVLIAVLWSFFGGLLGTVATWAWFTDHVAAKWNENWLQLNPLLLLLIVLIPVARRWPMSPRRVTATIMGLSLLGVILKILPWCYQDNWQIILLALPVNAGMTVGLWRFTLGSDRAVSSADQPGGK